MTDQAGNRLADNSGFVITVAGAELVNGYINLDAENYYFDVGVRAPENFFNTFFNSEGELKR